VLLVNNEILWNVTYCLLVSSYEVQTSERFERVTFIVKQLKRRLFPLGILSDFVPNLHNCSL